LHHAPIQPEEDRDWPATRSHGVASRYPVLADVVRLERVHPCERAKPARAVKIDRRRPGMY
jgi:hypothetical protein